MTEAEWLDATDPALMLESFIGEINYRRLRLLICACCQFLSQDKWPKRIKDAVTTADRYVEGGCSDQELNGAYSLACQAAQNATRRGSRRRFGNINWHFESELHFAADAAISNSQIGNKLTLMWPRNLPRSSEQLNRTMPTLLHDIFGNRFRSVAIDPSWRSSVAVAIAQGIYDDKAFDRLPILADALQDAGCENADILTHLRSDGPHVRGCWALDLVLGKQ